MEQGQSHSHNLQAREISRDQGTNLKAEANAKATAFRPKARPEKQVQDHNLKANARIFKANA